MRGRTLLQPGVITSIVDAEASVLCVLSQLGKLSMPHMDQRLMIAALHVDLRLVIDALIDHNIEAVAIANRGHRAANAVHEQLRDLVFARLLDDAAYSIGVWQGCLKRRTLRPLLPAIGSRRPR